MRNTRQSAVRPQSRVFSDPAVNAIYWPFHNASGNVVADKFGNAPSLTLAGDVAGAWANRLDGFTAHASGNYSQKMTLTDAPLLDLSNVVAGEKLVFAFRLQKAANPSAVERVFVMGSTASSGSVGHASGIIALSIVSNGNATIQFRPRTVNDASAGTNLFGNVGSVGTGAPHQIVFVIDLADLAAPVIYGYENGTQRIMETPSMANAVGMPSPRDVEGLYFGGRGAANGLITESERFGQNGSSSRIGEFLIWRTSQAMDRVLRVMDFHRVNRTLPAWMES